MGVFMPPRQGRTRPQTLHAAERRQFVYAMRVHGAHYRTILEACKQRFGDRLPHPYNERSVAKDVCWGLDHLNKQSIQDVAPLRELHTARLERMHLAFYDLALKGDNDAFSKCLKVLEREAKMWGLDAQPVTSGSITIEEHHRRCMLLLRVVQELIYARTASAEEAHAWLLDLQQRLDALALLLGRTGARHL